MGVSRQAAGGLALAVAGAVVVVGSLFLNWYHAPLSGPQLALAKRIGTNLDLTGWEANSSLDVLLVICAAVVIAGVVWARSRDQSAGATYIAGAGAMATALALGRLADPPSSSLDLRIGLPVAIAGGVLIVLGGLAMRRFSVAQ